jgi:hypothetical protein
MSFDNLIEGIRFFYFQWAPQRPFTHPYDIV